MPTGKFAISGLRVFGIGNGTKPTAVENLIVLRTEKDKRSAYLKWKPKDDAYAYNIYYGTNPQKLYTCIMVYDLNEYWLKTMDNQKTYYFTIEAINENGVSEKSPVIKSRLIMKNKILLTLQLFLLAFITTKAQAPFYNDMLHFKQLDSIHAPAKNAILFVGSFFVYKVDGCANLFSFLSHY